MSLLPIKVVRLVLPLPPGVNEYWRLFTPKKGGRPHMILSEAGRRYKRAIREAVGRQVAGTLLGPLLFRVDVFRRRRAGDVDRSLKALLDTLQGDPKENWRGLYLNDGQAVRLVVEHWDHQPKHARVQLTVTEDPNPRTPPEDWPISPAEQALLEQVDAELAEVRARGTARAKAKKTAVPVKDTLAQKATSASYPARKRGDRR